MRHLSIDIETFSSVDISKSGAHAYTQSPDFEILLNAYMFWGEMFEPVVLDSSEGSVLPPWFVQALSDPTIIKHAYNAVFEWLCFSRVLGYTLPIEQWRDTMLQASYCGYPLSLAAAGKAIGLPEDKQKLTTGKALIRYFCVPCKPTKANGGRTRNYPQHDPEKWALFKEYNKQDVVTEMTILHTLRDMPVPDTVQKQWETDVRINARGVAVDLALVCGAIDIGERETAMLKTEAVQLTGIDNPNSVQQITGWVAAQTGADVPNMRKETVKELLKQDNPDNVQRMLELRQELGKTSTKKYNAICNCIGVDNRVRGLLQFYGANRTGRWAGRLVQVQNLPRTYTDPLPLARDLVKARSLDGIRAVYGSVNDTLSQLIRTAFVASSGNILIDADFSAIEARVISWLAGEQWRLEVFRTHGKIYEASAAQMFGVPIERIKKGNPEYALRAKGKVAELALGYQGGVSALTAMGALTMGLKEDELPDIVQRWRDSNPNISSLWWQFNNAAIQTINDGRTRSVKYCTFALERTVSGRYLTIALPSGRKLYYVEPAIGTNRFGGASITYKGIDDKNQFSTIETYGGRLVENVTQAIARDCLAEVIERLETAGYPIVFHIHDEVVIDTAPLSGRTPDDMLQDVIKIMSEPIPWAQGLPLAADGWTGEFFKKE